MSKKNRAGRMSLFAAVSLTLVATSTAHPGALAQSAAPQVGEIHEDNLRIHRGGSENGANVLTPPSTSQFSPFGNASTETNPFASPPHEASPPNSANPFAAAPITPIHPASVGPGSGASVVPPKKEPANMWHPGKILSGGLQKEELDPTCNFSEAAKQAQAFPQSPEAAFIYSVALTRTSHVEMAVAEVKHARRLAQATGDPNYFQGAVTQYEHILQQNPEDDCIRYGLAWAYYMQAYLFAEGARRTARMQAYMAGQPQHKKNDLMKGAQLLASAITGAKPDPSAVPHIPGALENAPEWAVPQIKTYFEKCLHMIDEVVRRNPDDPWAAVYRIHLREEFSGDQQTAMQQYQQLKKKFPLNPAVSFFMADLNTREGNFGAGIGDFSRAVRLRMQGK